MTADLWIATGIAIPCVGCLIALVSSANKRQDTITKVFMEHVTQQTVTLVVMKDQLLGLCSSMVQKEDVKADLADQAHYIKDVVANLESKNSSEHIAITRALQEIRAALQNMCKQLRMAPNVATLAKVESIIKESLKEGTLEIQASHLVADSIEARKVIADEVEAKNILKRGE